jgi:FkbM family methyltransferase
MKKVFLNLGANTGNDIRKFRKLYKDNLDWDIVAFEPLPDCIKKLKESKNLGKFKLVESCAYVENSTLEFKLGKTSESGSLRHDKTTYMTNNSIKVATIDFPSWLLENYHQTDYILMTMDIEGSEYSVLEKMFENRSINFINELYIEFHGKKLKNFDICRENNLIKKLIQQLGNNLAIEDGHNHKKFTKFNI